MLAASWSAGACPAVRLLAAWALPGFDDSPRCSPNTAPTPVSRIAASPTIRIRCRIVVTSLGGQPGGTGAIASVPPGLLRARARPATRLGRWRWTQAVDFALAGPREAGGA